VSRIIIAARRDAHVRFGRARVTSVWDEATDDPGRRRVFVRVAAKANVDDVFEYSPIFGTFSFISRRNVATEEA